METIAEEEETARKDAPNDSDGDDHDDVILFAE